MREGERRRLAGTVLRSGATRDRPGPAGPDRGHAGRYPSVRGRGPGLTRRQVCLIPSASYADADGEAVPTAHRRLVGRGWRRLLRRRQPRHRGGHRRGARGDRRRRRGRRRPPATRCPRGSARRRRSGPTCCAALADEVRKRNDDLLPLIMAETGATLKVGSSLQVPQAVARFERYAQGRAPGHQRRAAAVDHADHAARRRRRHRRPGDAPAGRRRRVHLAVQLPAREHGRARSVRRSPPATRSS